MYTHDDDDGEEEEDVVKAGCDREPLVHPAGRRIHI